MTGAPAPAWPRGSQSGVPAAAWEENHTRGFRDPHRGCLGGALGECPGMLAGGALPPLQRAEQAPGVSAGFGRGRSGDAARCPAACRALQGHSSPIPHSHRPTTTGWPGTVPAKGHAAWDPQPGNRWRLLLPIELSPLLSGSGEEGCCGPGWVC